MYLWKRFSKANNDDDHDDINYNDNTKTVQINIFTCLEF